MRNDKVNVFLVLLIIPIATFGVNQEALTASKGLNISIQLSEWPNNKTIEEKGINTSDERAVSALRQSKSWIEQVFDPKWIPQYTVEYICMKEEEDGRDVVRTRWETKDYLFEVSQTKSIFVLKINLTINNVETDTVQKRTDDTRRLFKEIFFGDYSKNQPFFPHDYAGSASDRVLEQSFSNDDIHVLKIESSSHDIITGHLTSPQPLLEPYKFGWFDVLSWRNDGDSVIAFFQKPVGGSAMVLAQEFHEHFDKDWFVIPMPPISTSQANKPQLDKLIEEDSSPEQIIEVVETIKSTNHIESVLDEEKESR